MESDSLRHSHQAGAGSRPGGLHRLEEDLIPTLPIEERILAELAKLTGGFVGDEIQAVDNLPVLSGANAGQFENNLWTPPPLWVYDYRQNYIILGAGTTSVSLYRDRVDPSNLLITTALSGTWEPKHCIVRRNQRLIAVSVGGGVTWRAEPIMIKESYLAKYL